MDKKLRFWLPFSLTGFILLADQITKALVVKYLPIPPGGVISRPHPVLGDFLRFTHIRNTAIVFGWGQNLPDNVKTVLFIAAPLVLLGAMLVFYLRTKIDGALRWVLAAILGGGLGNMLDRLFRSGRVVDFIDVKFFGLFGWDRWPTFNLADSSIVIASFFLLGLFLKEELAGLKKRKEKNNEQKS